MADSKQKIVILGAGFGGVTTALKLARKTTKIPGYEITLVDQNPHHLFTPALYEIASIPSDKLHGLKLKSAIVIPIEEIVADTGIKFLQDKVIGLDKVRRAVVLKDTGALPFYYLVWALGSETNHFNIPGLKEHSYALKCFEDALRIRNKVESLLLQNRPLELVVGGAGASGVELAAEFSNFVCALQKKVLHNHPVCDIRITLVEATPEILPGFSSWAIELAEKRLAKLSIEIKTNSPIFEVAPSAIKLKDGKELAYDLLVWTGGVTSLELFKTLGLPTTAKGNLTVNHFLEVEPGIFAVGDNAGFLNPVTGKQLLWNVPVAEAEAYVVAENIVREIRGKKKRHFLPPKKYPFVLTVGKKYALADLTFIRFAGFWGWAVKILVELRYLLKILPPLIAFRHWLYAVKTYVSND